MAALEAGIEWLRPLANNQPWDYCIIWKLGDDPSRFIEWGECCCSGGREVVGAGIKKKGEDSVECKDALVKHPIQSDSCKRLAQLPSVIPLYLGIHGEVVISNRPRWTKTQNDEPNGTQVLIPVAWGLIEIFTTKHVPRDQELIDFISARFRAPFKQVEENWLPSLLPLRMSQPTNYSSFERSSTGSSSLSDELQLIQIRPDHVVGRMKPSKDYSDPPRRKCADSAVTNGSERVSLKLRLKTEKRSFKSKNLVTERNRRKRIKDGELALRALVPKITKMDRTSTLVDAADYIKELLETVGTYQDELEALEAEDCKKSDIEPEYAVVVRDCAEGSEKTLIVVEVEVNQLGVKDFLVKVMCKQRRGAFSRLVQVIDSLGFQVADANVTTLHGLVSNVLKVEAMRADLDPTTLKNSLVHLGT